MYLLGITVESCVPMIGIPFFGDQHIIGSKINKLNLGIAFMHNDINKFIGTEDNHFNRASLTYDNLHTSIDTILINHKDFVDRILSIKNSYVLPIYSIITSYYNYPITWKNGDYYMELILID